MTSLRFPLQRVARPALALGLVTLLAAHPALAAVGDEPLPSAPQPTLRLPHFALPPSPGDDRIVGPLTIIILDGEGALNNIRQRTAREPIVQVEDKNHKRVTNGYITFAVQPSALGAGAAFAGGATAITVALNNLGQATASGLVPNNTAGTFTITVTVVAGTLTATTILTQTNLPGGAATSNTSNGHGLHNFIHLHHTLFYTIVGGVVVGTTVTAVVLATHNSGTNITAGPGTVGTP